MSLGVFQFAAGDAFVRLNDNTGESFSLGLELAFDAIRIRPADGSAPAPTVQTTAPISGAVALPGDFDLSFPYQAGERVRITSGYSPNGGSSFHAGTNRSGGTNDHYALDFTLPDHANGGLGQPTLAAASGTVIARGWAQGGFASYGRVVVIRHDYNGDGNTYYSLYAHLSGWDVSLGAHVAKGDQIGRMGSSGANGDGSFAPHGHLAVWRNAVEAPSLNIAYGGQAVVPEAMDGQGLLQQGQIHISGNN